MFAHQVIDDLLEICNHQRNFDFASTIDLNKINLDDITNQKQIFIELLKYFISLINDAQKFSLSDIEYIWEIGKSNVNKALFTKELGGVRLPYKISWFDYLINQQDIEECKKSSKRGILGFELKSDLIFCHVFSFIDRIKRWIPSLFSFIISIDKPLSDHKDFYEIIAIMMKLFHRKQSELNINWASGNIYPLCSLKFNVELTQNCIKEDGEDLSVLNTSLQLLNCYNIGMEKILPPKQLNIKRIKNNKTPLFSYHTLILKPITQRQENIPKHLWENRIHLCRGHFKTYTIEKPLFGHIIGRFWWQAQARGNKKLGIVMKRYEIDSKKFMANSATI